MEYNDQIWIDIKKTLNALLDSLGSSSKANKVIFGLNIHSDQARVQYSSYDAITSAVWSQWRDSKEDSPDDSIQENNDLWNQLKKKNNNS